MVHSVESFSTAPPSVSELLPRLLPSNRKMGGCRERGGREKGSKEGRERGSKGGRVGEKSINSPQD